MNDTQPSRPNKEDAGIVLDRLMQTAFAARQEIADRDPEGRSFTLE